MTNESFYFDCPMGALIFSSTLRCDFDTIFM